MQEIMRIGDEFVLADEDIKDICSTSKEITNIAEKYKTDVLAVVGKGDEHHLTTIRHERQTKLEVDIARTISMIESIADSYDVNIKDVAEVIKLIIDKGI